MQRVSNGYTIIEVLIFLAVSGVLLATSMTFLSGREASNRFSQSMRDIQSKVQDWINDVPTGFAGASSSTTGLGNLKCQVSSPGARPQITSGNGSGTPDCIFLGKAIQFTDSSSKVYAYSVFGSRLDNSGDLAANLVDASPAPAVGIAQVSGASDPKTDLTDTYTINGGTTVLSVNSTGNVSGSHMAGFFLSFNPLVANRNGSQDLRAYQYKLTSNSPPGNLSSGPVDDCITFTNTCAKPGATPKDQWPDSLQDWQICFQGTNGDTALLTVSSSNGKGATTKLEFKACG